MVEITHLLDSAAASDRLAAGQLLALVYDQLRAPAAAKMAAKGPGHTINATALVHEAYLPLVGDQHFDSQGQFFAAAAEAMRRILGKTPPRRRSLTSNCSAGSPSRKRARHWGSPGRSPTGTGGTRGPGSARLWKNNYECARHFSRGRGIEIRP